MEQVVLEVVAPMVEMELKQMVMEEEVDQDGQLLEKWIF